MTIRDLADAVKRSVTARQVAEHLGLNVNPAGFCKCPIHGEKTGSMKVYPGSRGWFCFGCHQGGSVIDLVMLYYGLDMKESIALLNDDFSLGLPIGREATKEQQEEAKRRAEQREREQAKRDARKKAQNDAFERYCDLGWQIGQMMLDKDEFAPKKSDEEWDDRFKTALNKLAELKEEAETEAIVCFAKEA